MIIKTLWVCGLLAIGADQAQAQTVTVRPHTQNIPYGYVPEDSCVLAAKFGELAASYRDSGIYLETVRALADQVVPDAVQRQIDMGAAVIAFNNPQLTPPAVRYEVATRCAREAHIDAAPVIERSAQP